MFLSVVGKQDSVKENLPRRTTNKVAAKKPASDAIVMRDKQPTSKRSEYSSAIISQTSTSSSDDEDMNLDVPITASGRTNRRPPDSSAAKQPLSSSSRGATTSTSKALAHDLPPVAGSSNATEPVKPQFKMSPFTYREYFPRPNVRYVTNPVEADELVQALNGYVYLVSRA